MRNLILLLFLFPAMQGFSQQQNKPMFTTDSKLPTVFEVGNVVWYMHTFEKGHSLYSLSKAFGTTVEEIMSNNQVKDATDIDAGKEIAIRIDQSKISTSTSNKHLQGTYLPLTVVVEKGLTLYSISKMVGQSVEELIKRNGLASASINVGQHIIYGWYPLGQTNAPALNQYKATVAAPVDNNLPIEAPTLPEIAVPMTQISGDTSQLQPMDIGELAIQDSLNAPIPPVGFNVSLLGNITYQEGLQEIKTNEVARWDQSISDNGYIYALHNDAVIDSYIEVFYPVVNRSIRAKVIGKIPAGTFSSQVQLILSPKAAEQLGAIDKKFRVEIKYLKR